MFFSMLSVLPWLAYCGESGSDYCTIFFKVPASTPELAFISVWVYFTTTEKIQGKQIHGKLSHSHVPYCQSWNGLYLREWVCTWINIFVLHSLFQRLHYCSLNLKILMKVVTIFLLFFLDHIFVSIKYSCSGYIHLFNIYLPQWKIKTFEERPNLSFFTVFLIVPRTVLWYMAYNRDQLIFGEWRLINLLCFWKIFL